MLLVIIYSYNNIIYSHILYIFIIFLALILYLGLWDIVYLFGYLWPCLGYGHLAAS